MCIINYSCCHIYLQCKKWDFSWSERSFEISDTLLPRVLLSSSGIFRSSLEYDSPSIVSSASVAAGNAKLSPVERGCFTFGYSVGNFEWCKQWFYVTVVVFKMLCFSWLNLFCFLWENSVVPIHSACTVSRCLFSLFGFILSAANILKLNIVASILHEQC